MVCTSFTPFAIAMCLQRFNVKIYTAILHKFRFLVTKTATAQTNTAKHLTVCKSYPRKGFFPALAKLQWRFVSSYLRLTSAVLLSCLSVSIEVGLSSSLTCMSCGVSAIEDDGLSATNVGGLSSSLSCVRCGCLAMARNRGQHDGKACALNALLLNSIWRLSIDFLRKYKEQSFSVTYYCKLRYTNVQNITKLNNR